LIYILYQRTGYLKNYVLLNKALRYLNRYPRLYTISNQIKSSLFKKQIQFEFNQDINKEFETIIKYLPDHAENILDIGCGVAGIDALIGKFYKGSINVFLLDKSQLDQKVYYEYEEKGSFYNSLLIAKQLLAQNDISPNKIFTQEATASNSIDFDVKFDLIISLISWGFHYPVSTYLETVYNKLRSGGRLILDIRKNTQGEEEIKHLFGTCKSIYEGSKHHRYLAIKA
ncbi:MAG: hypothetical protein AAGI23_11685, partial [Bacteroidota bacterium]